MKNFKLIDLAVDKTTLYDFFISSVNPEDYPKQTEEHIDELYDNFIIIPKEIINE